MKKLSAQQQHLLVALAAGSTLKAHRTVEGAKLYRLHSLHGVAEEIAAADPEVTRIPRELLDDPSEAAGRKVARMKRNYAFDRARYFLPAAAETNVMLLMSARGWVQLCQHLLSHPAPEAREVGAAVRQELEFAAPRLLKHAEAKPSLVRAL